MEPPSKPPPLGQIAESWRSLYCAASGDALERGVAEDLRQETCDATRE
jgi:hypothetical protein